MKKTKSLSIIFLAVLFALSFVIGISLMSSVETVKAAAASQVFTYEKSDYSDSDIKLENDNAVIPMKNGNVVKIKRDLLIDNFGIKFYLPSNVKKLTMTVTADSLIATGNPLTKDGETTYETEIKNELVFEKGESNKLKVVFNGVEDTDRTEDFVAGTALNVNLTLVNDVLKASVNSNDIAVSTSSYYKLANNGAVKAEIAFEAETEEDYTDSVEFSVEYIDQDTTNSEGNFKQSFKLKAEETEFEKIASPRITLNDSFFAGDLPSGVDNVVLNGKIYSVTVETYSITGESFLKDNLKIDLEEPNGLRTRVDGEDSSKKFIFSLDSSVTSCVTTVKFIDETNKNEEGYDENKFVCGSLSIKVVDKDEQAPVYIDGTSSENKEIIDSFIAALKKATKAEYEIDDVKSEYSIRLGESQYLELPSFKSLVKDNLTSYENLKYTVYYNNITDSASETSALKIPVKVAGDYNFYVVFTDEEENAMETKDFYEIEDGNKKYGIYGYYVGAGEGIADYTIPFAFTLADDAPMLITAATQGSGYKGVTYTAAEFDIIASGYNSEYSLYYSASEIDKNADGWKRIYSLTEITEGAESEDFSSSKLEEFAYNGKLTFTPVEKGYYKIVCKVNSSNTERSVSESTIIKVSEDPSVVKPDSKWLQNNLWSVIFLSVGTLCLIGIIVLLCIKPKSQETNGEVKTVKVRSKKK